MVAKRAEQVNTRIKQQITGIQHGSIEQKSSVLYYTQQ